MTVSQADASGQSATDPAVPAGFYVAVRTGERLGRTALALGPFTDRAAARAAVDQVRSYVLGVHRGSGWWNFETARVPARSGRALPLGSLNAELGMEVVR